MKLLILYAIFCGLFFISTAKELIDEDENSLVIGTFNIQWLGDGFDDKVDRTNKDFMNLAFLIENTGAEIFALQEVENWKAIESLISFLPGWSCIFLNNSTLQNQVFIYKNYIKVPEQKLFSELEVEKGRTRKGSLIKINYGNEDIFILNIHLKSTSRYDNTPEKKEKSFQLRNKQARTINKLAKEINKLKSNLIVLGDFNDNPTRKKSQIKSLESNLYFPTKKLKSCKAFYFDCIDHIAINKYLKDNLEPYSQIMIDTKVFFKEKDLKKISDHCPVLIKLNFN